MPILNNIPRKNATPIRQKLWPRESLNANGQHVPNGFDGLTYNSQFTETDTPPLATHYNTATITSLKPTRQQIPGITVPLKLFQRVNLFAKSLSFNVGKTVPVVKRVNGPSSTSDTPFHPKVQPKRQQPKTHAVNVSGEKITPPQGSFFHTTTGNTLTAHAPNDPLNEVRWSTVKTGAANV